MLGIFKEMGVNMLVDGDSRCIQKVQGPSQELISWSGMVTHTTEGVCGLVSQYRWDKVKISIRDLVNMYGTEEGGLEKSKMELIRGFLVDVARTYQYMNPKLKGFHLNLESWMPFKYYKGWKM